VAYKVALANDSPDRQNSNFCSNSLFGQQEAPAAFRSPRQNILVDGKELASSVHRSDC